MKKVKESITVIFCSLLICFVFAGIGLDIQKSIWVSIFIAVMYFYKNTIIENFAYKQNEHTKQGLPAFIGFCIALLLCVQLIFIGVNLFLKVDYCNKKSTFSAITYSEKECILQNVSEKYDEGHTTTEEYSTYP